MATIAIIGSGITGVTTAYELMSRGHSVTVFERNRYASMDASFGNGGQLSVSNAEVWTNWSTIFKGMKWLLRKDAPFLINLAPNWHKYSWLAEFLIQTRNYEKNTEQTVRLALAARRRLFAIAETEAIDFNHEKRGILHFYRNKSGLENARKVNQVLSRGGLVREEVSPCEIRRIEPTLSGPVSGGFYTQNDSTGDSHMFSRNLMRVCEEKGVTFRYRTEVTRVGVHNGKPEVYWASKDSKTPEREPFDALVVCAGIASRDIARQLGDRINIHPVKGYSLTVQLRDEASRNAAPWVSLLDESTKIVGSRLGEDRYRVAGTAEINNSNLDIRADRIRPLLRWVEECHPDIDTSQATPWAGLRPMTPSMMPRVGPGARSGVFYNTGHGHLGWTLSAATAEIIAGVVSERA